MPWLRYSLVTLLLFVANASAVPIPIGVIKGILLHLGESNTAGSKPK